MTYPFVASAVDLGPAKGPRLAMVWHMAEGGGTVGYLAKPNPNGVSVHYVVESTGRVVQMLPLGHMHSSIRTSDIRLSNDEPYVFEGERIIYGRSAARAILGAWADIAHGKPGPNHATIAVEVEGFASAGPNLHQRAAIAELAEHVGAPAHLGHRDFADYKRCPGQRFPWSSVNGHATEGAMNQLPITDRTPHLVDIPAPVTFYELDGTVKSTGHTGQVGAFSPYIATQAGTKHFYAIYAGRPDGTSVLVLTRPKTARPIPAPPAADVKHAISLSIDGAAVYESNI